MIPIHVRATSRFYEMLAAADAETCDECDGKGVYTTEVDDDMVGETCELCHGTGWVAS